MSNLNVHASVFVPDQHSKQQDSRKVDEWRYDSAVRTNQFYLAMINPNYRSVSQLYSTFVEQAASAAGTRFALHPPKSSDNGHHTLYPRIDNTATAVDARLVLESYFGCDNDNLLAWQDVCFFCGRTPQSMPKNIAHCKQWLRHVHVNIFDLVHAIREYRVAEPRFSNARELLLYSKRVGKVFPLAAANGNEIIRFLLKKWV